MGRAPGKGGTGVLSVDGKEVDRKTMAHSVAFLMALDETFDIGLDTRTPVDDLEYQVPFAFTGTIDSLTIKTGHEQLTDADRQRAQHVLAAAHDSPLTTAVGWSRRSKEHLRSSTPPTGGIWCPFERAICVRR